jgi:hypothetical protein
LSSSVSVLRELRAELAANLNTAVVSYSFPHNASGKGLVPVLSTLVAQLCHKTPNIPQEITTMVKENPTQVQKTPEILIEILRILAAQFGKVHVVLDASAGVPAQECTLEDADVLAKFMDVDLDFLILNSSEIEYSTTVSFANEYLSQLARFHFHYFEHFVVGLDRYSKNSGIRMTAGQFCRLFFFSLTRTGDEDSMRMRRNLRQPVPQESILTFPTDWSKI